MENVWDVPDTEHSDKFYDDLMSTLDCLRAIVADINDRGYNYDENKLEEVAGITSNTVDMYGNGFLPTAFYKVASKRSEEMENGETIWKRIHEKDDDYFAITLASFFSERAREEFLDGYIKLFSHKDAKGELLADKEDREILWEWMNALVESMIQHEHLIREPCSVVEKGKELRSYKIQPEDRDDISTLADLWDIQLNWY